MLNKLSDFFIVMTVVMSVPTIALIITAKNNNSRRHRQMFMVTEMCTTVSLFSWVLIQSMTGKTLSRKTIYLVVIVFAILAMLSVAHMLLQSKNNELEWEARIEKHNKDIQAVQTQAEEYRLNTKRVTKEKDDRQSKHIEEIIKGDAIMTYSIDPHNNESEELTL